MRGASHDLALQLVAFSGTRWSIEAIIAAMDDVAPLLAPCGVALNRVELQVLRAPRALRDYYTPVSRKLVRAVEVTKPAIFFVEDTRNRPAFDAEAIGRSNAATRPELSDTIWIAYGSRDLAHVIAHELVHVLSDSGAHSEEPGNLMQEETSTSNRRLDEAQCAKLRATGEANGLLTPRTSIKAHDRSRKPLVAP